MLIVKRIHAAYTLQVDDDVDRAVIDRVHGFHADHCPVARSVRDAIDITTAVELAAVNED